MPILYHDPVRDLVSLRDAMNRLMEASVVPSWFTQPERETESGARLPLDAYTTDEDLIIVASVPGLKPEEVEITLEGDQLTIKGELQPPLENVKYLLNERLYGRFHRALTLNIPVEEDEAKAEFKNGVLTLTLPKAAEARPHVIKIQAKS
ncbi:MAG: Hsp20/alpha crystallin family protein [Anaerolineae bacterium]|nr:Hsp20/alpha crystallin family protein [Anaerolineae bacterium]